MAVRSKSEVGQWRMADISSNLARSIHPRRICNRRRIQDDRLLRRADRARYEYPRVRRHQADLEHQVAKRTGWNVGGPRTGGARWSQVRWPIDHLCLRRAGGRPRLYARHLYEHFQDALHVARGEV